MIITITFYYSDFLLSGEEVYTTWKFHDIYICMYVCTYVCRNLQRYITEITYSPYTQFYLVA